MGLKMNRKNPKKKKNQRKFNDDQKKKKFKDSCVVFDKTIELKMLLGAKNQANARENFIESEATIVHKLMSYILKNL